MPGAYFKGVTPTNFIASEYDRSTRRHRAANGGNGKLISGKKPKNVILRTVFHRDPLTHTKIEGGCEFLVLLKITNLSHLLSINLTKYYKILITLLAEHRLCDC